MKLRIYGNNVRLRLSQPEVIQLAAGECLIARTALYPQSLTLRVQAVETSSIVNVDFSDGVLNVTYALRVIDRWANSAEIGIDEKIVSPHSDEALEILIEKDFECLHGESDNQPDSFPNPLRDSQACAKL